MPYEAARAHAELGRHLPPDSPARHEHLGKAAALFEQLGSTWDLARVRALRNAVAEATP